MATLWLAHLGCDGPEAVRVRGERGADPHNYDGLPLAVPSKLDDTKDLAPLLRGPDDRRVPR